jgi:hypothetical protein
MNKKSITEANDPALTGSLPALKRAAARARQIAAQTGTRLVVAPPIQPLKVKAAAKPR